jgi:tRNA threonylcarbamoyl adenosine modification protein (Sua5/YciO/YrdC/YwlC family)
MIEYVFPNNVDDRVIERAKNILLEGGLVAYPTDTNWSIGCYSNSKEGIAKLTKLKGDPKYYTLTLVCSNISQISEVADLSNTNFRYIKKYVPGPYVFILPALDLIEKKICMKRLEVGVRIPSNLIPKKLVESIGFPILSLTASKKMTTYGWWDPVFAEENLFEFGYELEDIENIDLIIDTGEPLPKILSTVIRLSENEPEIIRIGSGKL